MIVPITCRATVHAAFGSTVQMRTAVEKSATLKHRLRPMRGLQRMSCAKAVLKGVETFRAIRVGHFHGCQPGVLNEICFVRNLFEDTRTAA